MAGEWEPLDLSREIEKQLAELHQKAVERNARILQLREDLRRLGVSVGAADDMCLRTDLRQLGR